MSSNYYLITKTNAISKKTNKENNQTKEDKNNNTGNNNTGNNNNSKNTENNGEFKDFSLPQDVLDKLYDIKHYPPGYLERMIILHQQNADPNYIEPKYSQNDTKRKNEGGIIVYNPKRPI
jgi:hypothetical protein